MSSSMRWYELENKSPYWRNANHFRTRRSRKMWGGGACDDRGHTFCVRRSPPQEPPEGKRLPGAEGPPEGKKANVLTPLAATHHGAAAFHKYN